MSGPENLAFVLSERPLTEDASVTVAGSDEMIDRLQQTLDILARVESHAEVLRAHARSTTEPDALQLALDLRRLAHRLQAVGDVLSNHGESVLELENRILSELDDRYRASSARRVA